MRMPKYRIEKEIVEDSRRFEKPGLSIVKLLMIQKPKKHLKPLCCFEVLTLAETTFLGTSEKVK